MPYDCVMAFQKSRFKNLPIKNCIGLLSNFNLFISISLNTLTCTDGVHITISISNASIKRLMETKEMVKSLLKIISNMHFYF